jgi:hypothetical protein
LEPQRLTLYLPDAILAAAEQQASRAGVATVQEYGAELLRRAIEAVQIREQVAEVEAKRGPLAGLNEIADDPEYLAEWSAQAGRWDTIETPKAGFRPVAGIGAIEFPVVEPGIQLGPVEEIGADSLSAQDETESDPETVFMPVPVVVDPLRPATEAGDSPVPLGPAAKVVLRHAGQSGEDSETFLACLRRGEAVTLGAVAELARALNALEAEYRQARYLDRRVAFALHRLAYEGQILHSDAWPGTFDAWTVDTLRAVQEAVERILSGQDIRYYPTDPHPE